MKKEHMIQAMLSNVKSQMWPIFTSVNSKNTLNMYPLNLSWLLMGHI